MFVTVKYPRLFLAVVPRLYPWKKIEEIRELMKQRRVGLLFSYYHFSKSRKMKKQLLEEGVHHFFDFDGPIWMDSGAYSAWNSGKPLSLREHVEFIRKLEHGWESRDAVFVLDVIGDSKKTLHHHERMMKELDGLAPLIVPVVHFPMREIPLQYMASKVIALGGMVRSFQINRGGSPYTVARWIGTLFQENSSLKEVHVHGLGLGSPLLQVALQPPLSSCDWLGWRRNAAICEVYTPEGSKIVMNALKSRNVLVKRPLTSELFEKYRPPFINDRLDLELPGSFGFVNRALWNVWWFIKAGDHVKQLERSRYVQIIRRNVIKGLETENGFSGH